MPWQKIARLGKPEPWRDDGHYTFLLLTINQILDNMPQTLTACFKFGGWSVVGARDRCSRLARGADQ